MSDEEANDKGIAQREENNALLRFMSKVLTGGCITLIGLLMAGIAAAIIDHVQLGEFRASFAAYVQQTVEQRKQDLVERAALEVQIRDLADRSRDRITFTEVYHWAVVMQRQNNDAGLKVIVPEPQHVTP